MKTDTTWTVDLRRGKDTKTVHLVCVRNAVQGTVYETYPGWDIVRIYG